MNTLPLYTLELVVLPAQTDFVVTVAAVNGSARAGLERHFGVLTALCADSGKHLSYRPLAVTGAASLLLFSCGAAGGTALWLISIAFGREEFLLTGAESKRGTTIQAYDGFVLKTHMDDLLF